MKKIILIPPCFTHGDCLSVISMLYYFLNHYDKVYFYIGGNDVTVVDYYNDYFINDPLFNDRIFITKNPTTLINNGTYGEYHVCNVLTGDWLSAKSDFSDLPNIDKNFYFNDLNPLYNKLPILPEHNQSPNKHLPSTTTEVNHIFYYNLVGLNNNVRMDYFNYVRNIELEKSFKNSILKRFNIEGKYNIINDPINCGKLTQHIKNGLPTININFLAPCIGFLTTLLEDAESIHFIEGCNVNFFYHSQYKGIFNYNKNIYFHIWARDRNWPGTNMYLDYAWKMMDSPRLPNWVFIHNENEINII